MNVQTATTAELVAFYNAHAEKPVKRFSDRKTAERRVTELMARVAADQARNNVNNVEQLLAEGRCPLCGGDASSQTGNGPQGTAKGDNEAFCHECCGAYDATTGAKRKPYGSSAPSATRSEAIAESWKDPAVAAARAKRYKVYADGQLYKSVPEAFRALKLPMSKHIAFRGALRDAATGVLVFKHGDREVKFELATQE